VKTKIPRPPFRKGGFVTVLLERGSM